MTEIGHGLGTGYLCSIQGVYEVEEVAGVIVPTGRMQVVVKGVRGGALLSRIFVAVLGRGYVAM